jgi:hypothetical protein
MGCRSKYGRIRSMPLYLDTLGGRVEGITSPDLEHQPRSAACRIKWSTEPETACATATLAGQGAPFVRKLGHNTSNSLEFHHIHRHQYGTDGAKCVFPRSMTE